MVFEEKQAFIAVARRKLVRKTEQHEQDHENGGGIYETKYILALNKLYKTK